MIPVLASALLLSMGWLLAGWKHCKNQSIKIWAGIVATFDFLVFSTIVLLWWIPLSSNNYSATWHFTPYGIYLMLLLLGPLVVITILSAIILSFYS